MQVLITGRYDERLLSGPLLSPSSGALCSAMRASVTLKCSHRTAGLTQWKASFVLKRETHAFQYDNNNVLEWRGYIKVKLNYTEGEKTNESNRDMESLTTFWRYPMSFQSLSTTCIFYIFICVSYLVSSFAVPSLQNCRNPFSFLHLYLCFILLWHRYCTPPLSSQVPVAFTDSLQSAVNRTRVNLAPTHEQHTAHPPH